MADKAAEAAVVDETTARWVRAERAFTAVRLEGKSLRAVAEDLGVSHETVWRDVRGYEQYLAAIQSQRDPKEMRAMVEALVLEGLQGCRDIIKANPTKPLIQVGAWNTFASLLSHLRAVTGADVPKDRKPDNPGVVRVRWGGDDEAE
ncbi:MAG TPA: helix-turn-helix domain-containing protein [bacterium]|nr:helix-turn-helix domain-containing protein [bacterium]